MRGNKSIAGMLFCAIFAGCGPVKTVDSMDNKMTEMNDKMAVMVQTMQDLMNAIAGSTNSNASVSENANLSMQEIMNKMLLAIENMEKNVSGNLEKTQKTMVSMENTMSSSLDKTVEAMNQMKNLIHQMNEKMEKMTSLVDTTEQKLEDIEALLPDMIACFGYVTRVLARYSMSQDVDVLSKIVDATAYFMAHDYQTLLRSATPENRNALYKTAVQEFFRLVDASAKRVNYSLIPFHFPNGKMPQGDGAHVQDMIQLYAIASTLGTVSHTASLSSKRQLPAEDWLLFNGQPASENTPGHLVQKYPSIIYLIQKALGHDPNSSEAPPSYYQDVQDFEATALYILQLHRIYLVSMTLAAVCPQLNPYAHGTLTFVNSISKFNQPWNPEAPAIVSNGVMTLTPIEMLNRSAGVTEFLTELLQSNHKVIEKIKGTNLIETLAQNSAFKILENMREMPNSKIENNAEFNKALKRAKAANAAFSKEMEVAALGKDFTFEDYADESSFQGETADQGAPQGKWTDHNHRTLKTLAEEASEAWDEFNHLLQTYRHKMLPGQTNLPKLPPKWGQLFSFWAQRPKAKRVQRLSEREPDNDLDLASSFASNPNEKKDGQN